MSPQNLLPREAERVLFSPQGPAEQRFQRVHLPVEQLFIAVGHPDDVVQVLEHEEYVFDGVLGVFDIERAFPVALPDDLCQERNVRFARHGDVFPENGRVAVAVGELHHVRTGVRVDGHGEHELHLFERRHVLVLDHGFQVTLVVPDVVDDDGPHELLLGLVVVKVRPVGHAHLIGDLRHRHAVVALLPEQLFGRFNELLPPDLRVQCFSSHVHDLKYFD